MWISYRVANKYLGKKNQNNQNEKIKKVYQEFNKLREFHSRQPIDESKNNVYDSTKKNKEKYEKKIMKNDIKKSLREKKY